MAYVGRGEEESGTYLEVSQDWEGSSAELRLLRTDATMCCTPGFLGDSWPDAGRFAAELPSDAFAGRGRDQDAAVSGEVVGYPVMAAKHRRVRRVSGA